MKKIIFLLIGLFTVLNIWADDKPRFTTSAPDVVVNGDQFRLSFTINTKKVKDFRAPNIQDFDVLMGPNRSEQSSIQIINGKQTFNQSITYTYILMATKEGTFTIQGATIVADGQSLKSNQVSIKVLPPDKAGNASQSGKSGSVGSLNGASSGGKISNNDLFITATASKTTAYEQEAILLTYKVYTLVDLRSLNGNMPDMKDFHTQEVDLPRQKQFTLEHYNGRNYNTCVWSQYILYPQRSGKLEVPSIKFDGEIAQHIESIDPFDAFFNGTGALSTYKKTIVTPKVIINVKELPSGKPEGFSGGVGSFNLTSSINETKVKTNDAVTLKLIISGTGNMKLMENPEVKFPQDFETYDPKTENNYNLTSEGLSGSKVIEYLAIPRHAGNFTIPPIEFSYFDIKSNSYKVLKTNPYNITVEKGAGNADQVIADFTNKEDLKIIGSDVRYIKMGNPNLTKKGNFFFGTTSYYAWYIVPFLIFAIVMIVCRKQAMENANVAKVRTKKANKVATKRLKAAGKLLAANKQAEFYDELLKALWGYTGDKLNIPVSELSKDNIEEKLREHQVNDDLIKEFVDILNDAEFARFAPGDPSATMDKEYQAAIDVISKMENSIKH
ncbi:MAG: BatD family protein [Phocaeicola sp.]|uniref:BatD family protein n=1 Tax=Phocaeicola sp. TaxID=2773926 RepID=UPI003FA076E0